jgi:hypothetical protein
MNSLVLFNGSYAPSCCRTVMLLTVQAIRDVVQAVRSDAPLEKS